MLPGTRITVVVAALGTPYEPVRLSVGAAVVPG
jgi:hypothetical protein